ncbi:MAG: glycosyltransferase family 2 protein [Bacilli bacterium]|nr:glycosyltransferase family 2 protein [Bacilli bacterium]
MDQETKKTLEIVIGCYNEEENVKPLVAEIRRVTNEQLPNYRTKILFIDNCSTDNTRALLREICAEDKDVRCIFNAKNFGHIRSPYHALTQAKGDLVMLMCADFQDPPELIPEFVHKWEEGYRVIVGTKKKSKTNPIVHAIRKLYYHIIHRISDVEQIENFTGFGLYDQSFIQVLAGLDDPYPYMRGIVAELGYKMTRIEYVQPERRAGKSHNNFGTLYDMAMNGITSYTKFFVRIATFVGAFLGFLGFAGLVVYLVFLFIAIANGTAHPSIVYPIITSSAIFTGIILFFLGMVGEYVLQINTRVLHRPFVVEEERINDDD